MVFFFFSSRRRHTRSDRDWSSDVCSSDLLRNPPGPNAFPARLLPTARTVALSAVAPQQRPQRPPAGLRAGADADLQAGPVVLHVVGGVIGGQQAADGEVRLQLAERVDHRDRAVGGL